jgi:hypothetical protein
MEEIVCTSIDMSVNRSPEKRENRAVDQPVGPGMVVPTEQGLHASIGWQPW